MVGNVVGWVNGVVLGPVPKVGVNLFWYCRVFRFGHVPRKFYRLLSTQIPLGSGGKTPVLGF